MPKLYLNSQHRIDPPSARKRDGSISILDYSLGSVGFIQDLEILLYE